MYPSAIISMIIIKHFPGIKKLTIIFGIISAFCIACKKESSITSAAVVIQNEYFESLDSVKLSGQRFKKLNTGEQSEKIILQEGQYVFSCITNSNLIITANIKLIGSNKTDVLVIKSNGSVQLN